MGIGYFTEVKRNRNEVVLECSCQYKARMGKEIIYFAGDIRIRVKRYMRDEDLVEEYIFRNLGNEHIFADIGIYTPFNDNYPQASNMYKYAYKRSHLGG